jgi:FlaA1/EpsC-like NDP-sugar epimerase
MFKDKRVLVTGCCGTVGSELIRQLSNSGGAGNVEIVGIDIREESLFFQEQEYIGSNNVNFLIVDIRDEYELSKVMSGIDVVFHTAALKHVVMTERSPEQVVKTNILGVQNVVRAALAKGVSKVLFTSSDKAVNPTSVMGTSKLMGERIFSAANTMDDNGTVFSSTRFGNVLGSSGSVIQVFHNQLAMGKNISLTHSGMTRFVMSVEQSVELVLSSVEMARGGEVFVTKMPVIAIRDLAQAMIEELAVDYGRKVDEVFIEEVGINAGEKVYEELMSDEETRRAIELENYYCIFPAFKGFYKDYDYESYGVVKEAVDSSYVSSDQTLLSITEIRKFLRSYDLLRKPKHLQIERYWPGDKESRI